MDTKRVSKSILDGTQMVNSSPSITDLPSAIFVDIILRLSTMSIISCKRVCKAWHGLISSPRFAELHLAQSKTVVLFKESHCPRVARSLYLVEPEDGRSFDLGFCWCESSPETKCIRCGPAEVKVRLKIPLRNAQVMLDQLDVDADAIFAVREKTKREHLFNLKSNTDYSHERMCFCNGFLCLGTGFNNEPVVVCNPITGEFFNLPISRLDQHASYFKVGFGFGTKKKQYKVVRMFRDSWVHSTDEEAEIHTIGTDSWRKVDISEFKQKQFSYDATYLHGCLHWILHDKTFDRSQSLASFDLDEERFVLYSVPSLPTPVCHDLHTAVLGGSLCVYNNDIKNRVHIWMMKEYGVSESWTKLLCIDVADNPGQYIPLSYSNNGALLMFNAYFMELVCYDDQSRGPRFKHLKYDDIESHFDAFAYTPSFVSLKAIVPSGNVEVLDISSRFGKIKFLEETYPVFLVEGQNSFWLDNSD